MKLLAISSTEKRWIATRLRTHVRCMLGIGLLCVVIQAGSPATMVPAESNYPVEVVTISQTGVKSVMPSGWRRTKNGWEHVSTWTNFGLPAALSINELIEQQRAREPQWIRFAMARISRVPPLMIALIQIAAIVAIVFVSDSIRRERKQKADMG